MQNHYSLIYREEEREMIPYCNAAGVGLIPWGPLHAGDLARSYDQTSTRKEGKKGTPHDKTMSDADLETIDRVGEIAQKRGWTRGQVALAWIAKRVSSPIVGCSSVSGYCLFDGNQNLTRTTA